MTSWPVDPETAESSVWLSTPLSVLCVLTTGDSSACIHEQLADRDEIDCETTTEPASAVQRLEDIDCLVCEHPLELEDDREFLGVLRERNPTLPVICLLDGQAEPTDELFETICTDAIRLEDGESPSQLAHRIRQLVSYQRLPGMTARVAATVEAVRDGVAIAGESGSLEFLNPAFAACFGYDRAELRETDWRSLFESAAVERIETAALPAVEDGWRWTGDCPAEQRDGSSIRVTTSVSNLGTGRLLFTIYDSEPLESE